jgi:probable HAF family extracellular repeat protein
MKLKDGFLACAVLASLFVPVAAAQTYTITDLGTLSGFSSSLAYDNNNPGQITGCSDNSVLPTLPCQQGVPAEGFLWTSGSMQPLGYLGSDDFSVGYVVNDSGVVVGYSGSSSNGSAHPFKWDQGNGMVPLSTLAGGSSYAFASAITNKSGVIAGESEINNGNEDVVLWTKDSSGVYHVHDEKCLPKALYCYAYDINENLQVTGVAYFFNNNNKYRAFLWSKTNGYTQLKGLTPSSNTIGEWLNNSGVVTGLSTSTKYPNGVSVYWDSKGIHNIGTLPGGSSSLPGFITDSLVIVGQSGVADGSNHAYIWTKKKKMRDLNNMIPKNSGWVLNHAASINKKGQIVGYGVINGEEHGFLLKP